MNQILVTKKLYITPELKRKKKIYKFDFLISVFLVCILISAYIYAEYDRTKSEEVSQDILSNIEFAEQEVEDNTTIKDNILIVVLNDVQEDTSSYVQPQEEPSIQTINGYQYIVTGTINIPKINVNYPIIHGITGSVEETDALLKISPTRFWGPDINEIGNYCIVGHNYRNSRFFSKVPTLVNGDIIEITDSSNRKTNYEVYDKYTVEPTDVSCTSQLTNGKKEITLITCTNDSKLRVIVKSREIK